MERTRGMALSADEKDKIRKEELKGLAQGLRLKLLDPGAEAAQVLSRVNEEPEQDRDALLGFVWAAMVEGLEPGPELPKSLGALEKLPRAGTAKQLIRKIRALYEADTKDKGEEKKRMLNRERKKLEAAGISGTAVQPKLPKEQDRASDFPAHLASCKAELL
jgi:hypothetical protein